MKAAFEEVPQNTTWLFSAPPPIHYFQILHFLIIHFQVFSLISVFSIYLEENNVYKNCLMNCAVNL